MIKNVCDEKNREKKKKILKENDVRMNKIFMKKKMIN